LRGGDEAISILELMKEISNKTISKGTHLTPSPQSPPIKGGEIIESLSPGGRG